MRVEGLGNLPIIPCSANKVPLLEDWPNAGQRIEPPTWWERVGVLTGAASNLDVIDIDPRNGGTLGLKQHPYRSLGLTEHREVGISSFSMQRASRVPRIGLGQG
jgi:hypothetical protein